MPAEESGSHSKVRLTRSLWRPCPLTSAVARLAGHPAGGEGQRPPAGDAAALRRYLPTEELVEREITLGGGDLGSRCILTVFFMVLTVTCTSVEAGVRLAAHAMKTWSDEAFIEHFRPRVGQIPLAPREGEDAIQYKLAGLRRHNRVITRRISYFHAEPQAPLTERQLRALGTTRYGRRHGADKIRRAREGEQDAAKTVRDKLAGARYRLRRARRRQDYKGIGKVQHMWRTFENRVGDMFDDFYLGRIPPGVLGGHRGRESNYRPTRWVLSRGHVIAAPERFERYSQELAEGCLVMEADGVAYTKGCDPLHAVGESFSTILCAWCGKLVDVGSKASGMQRGGDRGESHGSLTSYTRQEVFFCPNCERCEGRDTASARKILIGGLLGTAFDISRDGVGDDEDQDEEEKDANEKATKAKEADIDDIDDAVGGEGGGEGGGGGGGGGGHDARGRGEAGDREGPTRDRGQERHAEDAHAEEEGAGAGAGDEEEGAGGGEGGGDAGLAAAATLITALPARDSTHSRVQEGRTEEEDAQEGHAEGRDGGDGGSGRGGDDERPASGAAGVDTVGAPARVEGARTLMEEEDDDDEQGEEGRWWVEDVE